MSLPVHPRRQWPPKPSACGNKLPEITKKVSACIDCKYFQKKLISMDECRRYPPLFLREKKSSSFPNVRETDWCGEFVHKTKKENVRTQFVKPPNKPDLE